MSNSANDTPASKWENFWYYYKYHVLIGIVVALLLAVTLRDCVNRVEPDVEVNAILSTYATQQMSEAVEARLLADGVVDDLNADGTNDVFFQVMTLPEQIQSEQDMAVQTQIMLSFTAGEGALYLLDASTLEEYGDQEIFQDLSDRAQALGLSGDQVYVDELTGDMVALSLTGNTLLSECGFDTETMYLAMMVRRETDVGDEAADAAYDNSMRIMEHLLGHNPR